MFVEEEQNLSKLQVDISYLGSISGFQVWPGGL